MKLFAGMRNFSVYRAKILVLILLQGISSVFFLGGPYLSKLFIDQAFLQKDAERFFNLSIVGLALFLLSSLAKAAEDVIKNKISAKIKLDLARRFIERFFSRDLAYFQKSSAGESIYRTSNLDIVHRFLVDEVPHFVVDAAKIIIILAVASSINFTLTGILILMSPALLLWSVFVQRRMLPIYSQLWSTQAALSKDIEDALSKMYIVKALGLERAWSNRLMRALMRNIRSGLKYAKWSVINAVSASFFAKAIYGLISLYGGWLIIQGKLSLGSFTAAMLYIGQLGGLLEAWGCNFQYYSEHRIYIGKFCEGLEGVPAIKPALGALPLQEIRKEIVFQGVSFSYSPDKRVFSRLTLAIPCGIPVAIVGPSGCGKTTLVNLLLGLYQPQEGKILIDGKDLQEFSSSSLRQNMAIASQEPLLFNLSVKENISLGMAGATDQKIAEAAKIAQLQDVINAFPLRYGQGVGDGGCALSEGIKERVAIARAIIRDPELLILDEATASLDCLTEEKILSGIRERMAGKTVIIISHRLSAVKVAQSVSFLGKEGRIFSGTHDQLLRSQPEYAEFFRVQSC